MATIADLKQSISTMSKEQALSLVMDRRLSRRTPKDPPKKKSSKSTTRRTAKQPKVDVQTLFNSLEKQQLEKLIAKMEESIKDG